MWGVGGEGPLHVRLGERRAHLAEVFAVCPEDGHLPSGKARAEHEPVEPVVLRLTPPCGGEGLGENALHVVGLEVRFGRPETEVVDPDEAVVGRHLVGALVEHPHAHVLQQGHHVRQRQRPGSREQFEAQQPFRLQGLGQAQRDVGEVLGARLHVGDVGHRRPGREVVAVGGREGASETAQEAQAPFLAVGLEERLREVVGP